MYVDVGLENCNEMKTMQNFSLSYLNMWRVWHKYQ